MKKTLKVLGLVILIGLIIISLTGCGKDKTEDEAIEKLVATKITEDETIGNYKETIIVTYKEDKVETISMEMEFDKEEIAKTMYEYINMEMSSEDGTEVKQEGKKLIISMDQSTYVESEGTTEEDMTKEAFKKSLEESGYTVK